MMTVVYCANRAIYQALPTAVNSLLSNNPNVEKIHLMIEDDNISTISHPKVEFINLTKFDFLIRRGINCTRKYPYTAMVRVLLSKILQEPKVIYLDVDTIVDGNLEELWDFDLRGNSVGAVEEGSGYFNSGVLLMNLDRIRATGADDKLKNLLQKCKFQFPDQDAMNIIFKNSVAFIPERFNKIGGADFSDKETTVYHFAGRVKPWKNEATKADKAIWKKYFVAELRR